MPCANGGRPPETCAARARIVVRMSTYLEHLRALGPEGLGEMLERRPDLAAPPPATLRALAARAATRASLERALGGVDAGVLAACEAVLVLPAPVAARALAPALGVDAAHAAPWLATARAQGLVWGTDDALHAAPGLADVLGPYPAGLGPTLAVTLLRRSAEALDALGAALDGVLGAAGAGAGERRGAGPGAGTPADAARPAPDTPGPQEPGSPSLATRLADRLAAPGAIDALLAAAPAGAAAVLDALAWGPPVGRSPGAGSPAHAAVTWLLRHGLLGLADPQHVVLPREVALARRGGLVVAHPPVPPTPTVLAVPTAAVEGEGGTRALEAVRLVAELVAAWGAEPAPPLRAGGLGVRELRKVATRLGVELPTAALLAEVAEAARLVAQDGDEAFTATTLVDEWLDEPAPVRWATLAHAWLGTDRPAWLVGSRGEATEPRAALDPAARRSWLPRLRVAVLEVLDHAGGRLTPQDVQAVLHWRTPRAVPAPDAVRAVLAEAALLGVTGGGVLTAAGRALLEAGPDAAAAALDAALPPPVDDVLLGGDLTGVVPGRPTEALAALLSDAAVVESRGAGLTVRFTDASVRSALDTRSADELLAALAEHARTGVPQPLAYLVADAARRHGQVRAGVASCYLRGEPAALAGLVDQPRLRALGLRLLAPGVLVATAPADVVLPALRAADVPVVLEDAAGVVLRTGPSVHRVRARRPLPPPDPAIATRRAHRVAADLLAGHASAEESAAGPADAAVDGPGVPLTGTPSALAAATPATAAARDLEDPADPVEALAILRDAAARGTDVWLDVAGPGGLTRRRVRPLRVADGRVRVLDAERAAELTVAVHRIARAQDVETP